MKEGSGRKTSGVNWNTMEEEEKQIKSKERKQQERDEGGREGGKKGGQMV